MIKIRKCVFETNSSSTHSISISYATKLFDTIIPDDDGNIYLASNKDFGWEWKKYNDAKTKAIYAAIETEYNPNHRKMLEDVIKEHTGAKEVYFKVNGTIDHQSVSTAFKAFDTKESLKNWLFNPESWLFTGNDNEESPPNFYDIDFGIEYNYKLSFSQSHVLFEEKPSEEKIKESLIGLINHDPIFKKFNNTSKYRIIFYPEKSFDGHLIDSFKDIINNNIIAFKLKHIYDKNNPDLFLGSKIEKKMILSFNLEKI